MKIGEQINNKQNSEKFLKIQYAARYNYNSAELINYCIWIFCLISAFSIFLPQSIPNLLKYGALFVLNVSAYIMSIAKKDKILKAARLRKFFDAEVLDINCIGLSINEKKKLFEISRKICSKNKNKCKQQIMNTGRDNPPGVRNWYNINSLCKDKLEIQFECQCQNTWWNSKLNRMRTHIIIVSLFLVSLLFFILMKKNGFIISLLSSSGIILKLLDEYRVNTEYKNTSKEIEILQKNVEKNISSEGIEELQNLIDKLRGIPVLEINFLHKIKARHFTNEYESILNDCFDENE